jgi:hypoxanthine-DNA glycosylase
MTDISTGLDPIASPDAKVLILGSLPSQLSLQKQEYYGNPQNAFWRVMGELFDAGPDISYSCGLPPGLEAWTRRSI